MNQAYPLLSFFSCRWTTPSISAPFLLRFARGDQRRGRRNGRLHRLAQIRSIVTLLGLVGTVAGCGANRQLTTSMAPSVVKAKAAPVLTQSVFARDPEGQLSETAIQKILSNQLELELPARVGILPIVAAQDWRGPGPSFDRAPAAVAELSKHIRSAELFTVVTEMLPIPSGALGMEALREIAARYKLRYVILYREDVRKRNQNNPWALGYMTGIGTLFLPGENLKVDGYVEASLFDVKTGLLLFTTRRRVSATEKSNIWHRADKLDRLQAKLAIRVGQDLGSDIRRELLNFQAAVKVENARTARPLTHGKHDEERNASPLITATGIHASNE